MDFHRLREAALIVLNHHIKWPLSYIKPHYIICYPLDAAHKLFNQIDRYITNWVGYCHPSSIFLRRCSPVSVEDTLWMMSIQWNKTPAWSSEYHLMATVGYCKLNVKNVRAAGNLKSSTVWGNWGSQQVKKSYAKLFVAVFFSVRSVWICPY